MSTDVKQFPLCHSIPFRLNNKSYVQIGNVARSEICLAPYETPEDWDLVRHLKASWNQFTPTTDRDAPFLRISKETLRSLAILGPGMSDLNTVSRPVTCCRCGNELGPQLVRRHWEIFEMEGPSQGEVGIRVKGWSCLNTCKDLPLEELAADELEGRQVDLEFEKILSEMLGWNNSDSMKEYVEMLRRWKKAHDVGDKS